MESLMRTACELMSFHANLAMQSIAWVLLWVAGLWVLRVRAGALRYTAWLVVLVAIPLFPLVEGQGSRVIRVMDVVPAFRIPRIAPTLDVEPVSAVRMESRLPDSREGLRPPEETEGTGVDRTAGVSSEDRARSVSGVVGSLLRPDVFAFLAGVWSVGLLVMLLRMMLSYRSLLKIRRRARGVRDPRLPSMLEALRKEIGIGRSVRLEESDDIPSPVSYGVRRPVVLLPSSFMDSMSFSEMRWVLVHELAHIRRLDFVVTLLQRVLEAFFFYHPLVWYASSRLTLNREHACDDWVMSLGNDRKEYAMSLLGFMQPQDVPEARFVSALFGRPGKLARRIATITNTRRKVAPFASRRGVILTASVALLGLLWIGSLFYASDTIEAQTEEEVRDAGKDQIEALIKELEDKRGKVEAYRAQLTVNMEMMGQTITTEGTQWFKRPKRTRSDMPLATGGMRQIMISDGKITWTYQPQSNMAMKVDTERVGRELGKEDTGTDGASDPFKGIKRESLRHIGKKTVEGEEVHIFEAESERILPMFQGVTLGRAEVWVGAADGLVRKGVFYGEEGKELISHTYSAVAVNVPIPDSLFVFTPPEGVQVVDMTEGAINTARQWKAEEAEKQTE